MVRLSKKVEYGLIAIGHIAAQNGMNVMTAKEISEIYRIPYDLLAKVLQKMARAGLLISHQGTKGGYTLAKRPHEIPVAHIIHAIEGTTPMIAQCMSDGPDSCTVFKVCTIKSPLTKVQASIEQVFNALTLLEIV